MANNISVKVKIAYKVLKTLGYHPKYFKDLNFISIRSSPYDLMPELHKKIIKDILGDKLKEIKYSGTTIYNIYLN